LTLNFSDIVDGEFGAEQPDHVGLIEYVQEFIPALSSEEAAVRAAQVPE